MLAAPAMVPPVARILMFGSWPAANATWADSTATQTNPLISKPWFRMLSPPSPTSSNAIGGVVVNTS